MTTTPPTRTTPAGSDSSDVRDSSDVVVVGAGPTGLLLAGDLAEAGVRVTLLERRAAESNLTRAFAVHARTLEQLDARGLADALIATGTTIRTLQLFGRARLDLASLHSRFPFVLITPQYEVEGLLEERAVARGARIVRGAEVTGLRQDPDGVELDTRSPDGTGATHRAAWAVGADGVHSTVRRLLRLPFPGRSVVRSVILADVRLARAPEDVVTVNGAQDGFAFLVPFGDGWYRVIAWDRGRQLPDDAPVTLAEIADLTRRVLGTDFGMHDPRWMSRFHSEERQVPDYRTGRVLLAGDAAHAHSPAGGLGMNTSLQDAANLGWKLAAVVRGWAPESLLDTYQAERHPVGRTVLRISGALLRIVLAPTPLARAARAAVLTAVGRLGRVSAPATRRVSGVVSGVAFSYPAPRGAHRLTGRRAPDIRLAGGRPEPVRLYEALRGGRFVLVAPAAHGAPALAAPWADRVTVAAPASGSERSLLVRPDGYIAWAGDARDGAAVRAALTAWCGAPGTAGATVGETLLRPVS